MRNKNTGPSKYGTLGIGLLDGLCLKPQYWYYSARFYTHKGCDYKQNNVTYC